MAFCLTFAGFSRTLCLGVAAMAISKFLGVGHLFPPVRQFCSTQPDENACSTDLTMIVAERRDKSLSCRARMGRSASPRAVARFCVVVLFLGLGEIERSLQV